MFFLRHTVGRNGLLLGLYFLLTLVLTYPLILQFTTHVVGDGGDDPGLAWNLWWVPHALLDLNTSPIYTDAMFFPVGLNLGFYTLTYLNAFLAIPFQFAFGLVPAANLNLILSFTLSGFGAYLLVSYLLRKAPFLTPPSTSDDTAFLPSTLSLRGAPFAPKRWGVSPQSRPDTIILLAAFIAGLLYAFSANKFLYAALGQFNIASSQWIPFYILFLLKIFNTPNPPLRYGALLGIFLLAQALSEFIFASFLILFTLAYLIYWLVTVRFQIQNHKSKIINLVLAAVLFALAMTPILAAMFSDILTEGDFIQQGLGFSNIFSADLLGFFVPSQLHPLFGTLGSRFSFPYINFVYLGFTALVLAAIALWKIKPARIWGLWFALIALLTLGPTLRINGAETDLPLPFDLLLEIPLIKGNRYPSRWSVMLTLCLAVLVGYGIAYCLARIANRQSPTTHSPLHHSITPSLPAIGYLLSAICAVLLLFEHLSLPLPLSDFRVPEIYTQIRRDPGTFSVMEIPLAWRNGFRVTGSYRRDSQALPDRIFMFAQWYQTTQQHPILNGNTSRNPEFKFQYFAEAPVLNSLLAIQTGHDVTAETQARDRTLAPGVLQFFGTRYLVWHTPYTDENRDVANKTRAYIEAIFPVTKISESYENGRGVAVYRVNDPPAEDTLHIRPDNPLARLYLGEGWGAVGGDTLWAERNEAKIFFPLTAPRNLKLTLDNFKPLPSFGQGLTLRVNGQELAHYNPIQITGGVFSAVLPASALKSGMNELTFVFDKTLPIANIPDHPVSIVVRSAGEEQGSFAHIYVNGIDESPNEIGYNIVVVEPKTGQVQARASFDTFFSGRESTRMAEFLNNVAEGDLVAVAAKDTVSTPNFNDANLTLQAVDALRSIGARRDLRGNFRWSHAVIGVQGALPGSASESASETGVSQVYLNDLITSPNLAASIGEIRLEPAP